MEDGKPFLLLLEMKSETNEIILNNEGNNSSNNNSNSSNDNNYNYNDIIDDYNNNNNSNNNNNHKKNINDLPKQGKQAKQLLNIIKIINERKIKPIEGSLLDALKKGNYLYVVVVVVSENVSYKVNNNNILLMGKNDTKIIIK